MQILNTFLLFLRFWEIGSPSRVLLPCTCLLIAAILACQIMIWLIHSYLALLLVVVMCYAEAALLGTGLGELLYRMWRRAGSR